MSEEKEEVVNKSFEYLSSDKRAIFFYFKNKTYRYNFEAQHKAKKDKNQTMLKLTTQSLLLLDGDAISVQ